MRLGSRLQADLRGRLDEVSLPELLILLQDTRRSGCVRVTGEGTEGLVWLSWGDIVAARAGDLHGVDALLHVVVARTGEFAFSSQEWVGKPEIAAAGDEVLAHCIERYRETHGDDPD
jgi:hypothetical protein